MTPYRIRSQSVSERRRRGTLVGGLAVALIHDLKIKPHYPAEITGFGEGSLVTRGVENRPSPPQFHKIPLEFYTEGIFCQRKNNALKRFLPNPGESEKHQQEFDKIGSAMNHRMRFPLMFLLICISLVCASSPVLAQSVPPTVQQRLGYPASARLLVIHSDDLGMNHSVNRATFEALENGWITSASILVPCPWFPEVARWAKEHPDADVGIHQALNSEWTSFRWGPVSPKDKVPSLLDPDGYLPLDTPAVGRNAKLPEVENELRAQIDRALSVGIHLTHLES